ncbi:MAG: hypothetical protein ACRELU_13975 [Gemmatimonadota bacterium]
MRNSAFFALAVIALATASCSGEPTEALTGPGILTPARAETEIINERFLIELLVFVSCADEGAGELVLLEGTLHSLFHITINSNNFKVKVHDQPQGISGTGLTTGDKYQATGVTQETVGGSFVNGQFSDTFVNNFRIIGQGPGNNFLLHENLHITLNANGELTAFVDNFSVECK